MQFSSMNRRDFLQASQAAALAALATGAPKSSMASEEIQHPRATADSVILLWMAGGMAAPDNFDPKHYEPFKKGLEIKKIGSTFPAIDTVVDNIKLTKGYENLASVMDRATLIRSHVQPDLGNILHSRHQYHWHTGYVPPQTVAAPHIGAWISKILGPINPSIPAFIDVGQRLEGVGEKEELKAFHTAGFLGSEYGPFLLPYPENAVNAVRPSKGMTAGRFNARYKRYREMVRRSPLGDSISDYQEESVLRAMQNAHRLLSSPQRKAFDLSDEPKESLAKYDTGRFGRGCLLARRLVESGARFIEVTTEYVPFLHWDTHENGHSTVARMKSEIDRPITQLIVDLENRGLLDRTLVVIASEFSRDMLIEGVPGSKARDQSRARGDNLASMKHYGQHRHFTGGSTVMMFGGGMKPGFVYGKTATERPFLADKPVSVTDMHATIFTALGISPQTAFDIEQRPFYITKDGTGKPLMDVFA